MNILTLLDAWRAGQSLLGLWPGLAKNHHLVYQAADMRRILYKMFLVSSAENQNGPALSRTVYRLRGYPKKN